LFDKIEKWFEGFLNKVLKLRYLVVVVFLVVLLGSIYFATTQICISTSSPCGGPGRLTEKVSFSTSGMSLA
jgi:hypothetical protein